MKMQKSVIRRIKDLILEIKYRSAKKVFGIGMNKTGTTSLTHAMHELGFRIGRQREAELLYDEWLLRDFKDLVKYCRRAEFFQDLPFSLPYTYVVLDYAFPNSKFILTERDNSEQWYNSITKFHGRLWSKGDYFPPTAEDLKNADYVYKGFPYKIITTLYGTDDSDLYNKETLIAHYEKHNRSVKEYFRFRNDDLLVLNVSEKDAYKKLCHFLGVDTILKDFPHVNKAK